MDTVLPQLLPGEPAWGEGERARLREVLREPIGQLLLRRLIYERPEVTELRDREVRTIQSDTRAGFEACIQTIIHLAEGQPLSAADRSAQSKS
jgi:hypothetical protein